MKSAIFVRVITGVETQRDSRQPPRWLIYRKEFLPFAAPVYGNEV